MNQEKAKQILRSIKELANQDPTLSANEIRVIVALERAIARLMRMKELSDHLIFKGGFVLLKTYKSSRFTRDSDALAVSIDKEKFRALVLEALKVDMDDGMWFGDIQSYDLEDQDDYGAYRFDCAFQVGDPDPEKIHKLSRIHIDVGFSDRLPAQPPLETMPSLLADQTPISWKVYPIEYILAEKLETLCIRGSANSRAKDVYDLIYLIPLCSDHQKIVDAVTHTFKNRNTPLPISFAKKIDEFDQTLLKAAWPSVKILEEKLPFHEAWNVLRTKLKGLDGYNGI